MQPGISLNTASITYANVVTQTVRATLTANQTWSIYAYSATGGQAQGYIRARRMR